MNEEEKQQLLKALEGVATTDVNIDEVGAFSSEEQFLDLAAALLAEAAEYTRIAAGALPIGSNWTRNQAAIGGSVVRLHKNTLALLDQTEQRKRETSFVFARLGFETVVTIRYLIKHFSPDLIASYIKHSFKYEVRLRKNIKENIAKRSGLILPIEDRMLKSIERAFEKAGLNPTDMDKYRDRDWGGKNLYEKADDLQLGNAYLGAFAGPSQSVHGGWGDIYSHNLEAIDAGFIPKLNWSHPRPQLVTAVAILTLTAVRDYVGYVAGDEIQQKANSILENLVGRIELLDQAHEKYLSTKDWPKIR
jgi:Family of unknown function (DUF5677)